MKNVRDYIKKQLNEISNEKKNPFTSEEEKIMDFLIDANNIFVSLDKTHPSEEEDWNTSIHTLQRLMGQRVLRRDYPDYFYSNKK